METLLQDLRLGFRILLRRPVFTAVAVLSLALGIGANTALFSLANALLWRTMPAIEEPERLVTLYTRDAKNPGYAQLSRLNWKDYRDLSKSFSGILAYQWVGLGIRSGKETTLTFGQLVSGNYFDVLGIAPALGRTFRPEEDGEPGAHPVAVISHRFWQDHFGGKPGVVGEKITLNGTGYTVIGVAPQGFVGTDFGVQAQLWLPMAMHAQVRPNEIFDWYDSRRAMLVSAIGRLAPGADLARAQAELTTLASRLERDYPVDNKGRGVELVPLLQSSVHPEMRQGLLAGTGLLLAVTVLVLLIACANVSNLLLAQASARRREFAIRLSQGAPRGRLIRQVLTESVLLSLLGGIIGLLVAVWVQHLLPKLLPQGDFPVKVDLPVDVRVLAFTLGVALISGLLFGLAPALRSTEPEMVAALRSQAEEEAGSRQGLRLRSALVAGQVALSLVSLVAAGLFLRSLAEVRKIDPGFRSDRLAIFAFDTDLQGWDRTRSQQFAHDARDQIAGLPGVAAVAVAQAGPFQWAFGRTVFLEGGDGSKDGQLVQVNPVGPEYFSTVGVPLQRGRAFTEADRAEAPHVVIVNETLAAKLWPGQDPIGRRFHFFGDPPVEVVGVARNAKYNRPGEAPQPYVYEPLAQRPVTNMTLIVRAARDPADVMQPVQKQIRTLAPGLLLVSSTVPALLDQVLWAEKAGATLLVVFGLLALGLAAMGLYGVMSFSVTQRAREIGVRMALGARQGDVLGMVLRQGLVLVALGLGVGLLLALGVTRIAARFLVGVSPTDPLAFGTTSAVLLLVAFAATLLPALKASSMPPVVALRSD